MLNEVLRLTKGDLTNVIKDGKEDADVAVDGIWGLDSITHLQRRNVRLKQPHWKSTQSDVAKSDAIAKAEAKRARKKAKKDNA